MNKYDWVESVLINDEHATDDELALHFVKEGKMSMEEALFYVGQRDTALLDPLDFTLTHYEESR